LLDAQTRHEIVLPGFELPHTVDAAQRAFDDELARTPEAIADRIEGRPSQVGLFEEWLSCLNVRSVLTGDENRNHTIKTNIGDSLNVVVQVEPVPGRRFISEVLEINRYDPDADLF
jgi:hypothetical protein